MRYSNLHTHTTYSDGKHSPEENVLSAIEKNMLSLGFSDHSFTSNDSSYCMPELHYPEYLQTISNLKQIYGSKIDIYAGLEMDYYTEVSDLPFDYLIASVHYIIKNEVNYPIDHSPEQQLDCIQNAFHGDILAMAQCYYDMLCEHVERIHPTYVGHFDVITKFGLMPEDDACYRAIAGKALRRILKTCPYIEINTGAIARGLRKTPYPADYLLQILLDEGGKPVLGSDSHDKHNLVFAFDQTVNLLKTIGFKHIYRFNGRGFDSCEI